MTSGQDSPQPGTLLTRLLAGLTRVVCRQARRVIACAAVLLVMAATAILLGLNWQEGSPEPRSDDAFVRRQLDVDRAFGLDQEMTIVVRGPAPQLPRVLEQLEVAFLEQPERFAHVVAWRDLRAWRGKGLHFLTPEQLTQLDTALQQQSLLRTAEHEALQGLQAQLTNGAATTENLQRWEAWLYEAARVRSNVRPAMGDWYESLGRIESHCDKRPLWSADGTAALVYVQPHSRPDHRPAGNETVAAAERILSRVASAQPGIQLQLTGASVAAWRRYEQRGLALARALGCGFVGVLLLALVGFNDMRQACVLLATWLAGLVATGGILALTTGSVQSTDLLLLFVLVPWGFYGAVRYTAEFSAALANVELVTALEQAAKMAGPEMVLGSVLVTMLNVALVPLHVWPEGSVAWVTLGCVLSTLAGNLVLLPSLLACCYVSQTQRKKQPASLQFRSLVSWMHWFPQSSRYVGLVSLCMLVPAVGWVMIDFRSSSSQQADTAAEFEAQQLLVPCDTAAEARNMERWLRAQPEVQMIENPGAWLPEESDLNRRLITRVATAIAAELSADDSALVTAVAELVASSSGGSGELHAAWHAWRGAVLAHRPLPRAVWERVAAHSDPTPPRWTELPESLTQRMVLPGKQWLVRAWVHRDADTTRLRAELERHAPHACGEVLNRLHRAVAWREVWLRGSVALVCLSAIGTLLGELQLARAIVAFLPALAGLCGALSWAGLASFPLTGELGGALANVWIFGWLGGLAARAQTRLSAPLAFAAATLVAMLGGAGLALSADPAWQRGGQLLLSGFAAAGLAAGWLTLLGLAQQPPSQVHANFDPEASVVHETDAVVMRVDPVASEPRRLVPRRTRSQAA